MGCLPHAGLLRVIPCQGIESEGAWQARKGDRVEWLLLILAYYPLQSDDRSVKQSHSASGPFQTGQIWELKGLTIEIGVVGKLLVHYRLSRGTGQRGSSGLVTKTELGRYLKRNDAILARG